MAYVFNIIFKRKLLKNKKIMALLTDLPAQSELVGKTIKISFARNLVARVDATLVRCDVEPPYILIVRTVDGKHFLGSEVALGLPDLI